MRCKQLQVNAGTKSSLNHLDSLDIRDVHANDVCYDHTRNNLDNYCSTLREVARTQALEHIVEHKAAKYCNIHSNTFEAIAVPPLVENRMYIRRRAAM